jgi:Glyoxalase/Bleomycin resistance protein/Dioxygenase superfamily
MVAPTATTRSGIEHIAFQLDTRGEVDEAHGRCLHAGVEIQTAPEDHYAYAGEDHYSFFAFAPTGSGPRSSATAATRRDGYD